MKVLLDECVPERFRRCIPGHDVHSAKYAGFSGRKNGELLRLAAEAGYDVLLTVDQGIPFQQRMSCRSVALIVISAPSNDIGTLEVMADAVIGALATITAGHIVKLDYM
jgi:hypothetical protein